MNEKNKEMRLLSNQQQELRGMADKLIQFLEKPRPQVGSDDGQSWANELAERLTELHGKMSRHFHDAEKSELMDELVTRFPESTRAVEALSWEHDRILGDLRTVMGAVMIYSEGKEPENPRIRRWILSILEQLRYNESEETELLQKLHYQDLGGRG